MTGTDDVDIRLDEDTLQDRDDLDLQAEVNELRRRLGEAMDLIHEQDKRIRDLEQRLDDTENDRSPACAAERALRIDATDSLKAYERRVAEIWSELPKHATRNGEGKVTYSLDYDRLRDALAAVDPGQWESGEKVKSQQVKYAREAFEDVAHAFVKDGEGGAKKVVVYAEQWAVDRPEEVCRRLMSPRDVEEFIAGGGE